MPKTLLRASAKVVSRDQERARVARQLEEAQYGRGHLLLPIEQIAPNPRNPRQVFSEEAINELAESILAWGQLQPIVVRRADERYEIICGERRWRAHRRAGLPKIWAVERSATDAEAYKLALIENLHRVDLSHAEKVAALDQLAELAAVTGLRKTASEIKVSPGWLSTQLSLRQDPVIFPALEAGQISFAQAAELRRAPGPRAAISSTARSGSACHSTPSVRGSSKRAPWNGRRAPASVRPWLPKLASPRPEWMGRTASYSRSCRRSAPPPVPRTGESSARSSSSAASGSSRRPHRPIPRTRACNSPATRRGHDNPGAIRRRAGCRRRGRA